MISDTCSQSSCLMCLEAQHRLAFERRHGSDTFPYYIPESTATDLVKRCRAARVWNRKDGATIDNVLKQIQRAGLQHLTVADRDFNGQGCAG